MPNEFRYHIYSRNVQPGCNNTESLGIEGVNTAEEAYTIAQNNANKSEVTDVVIVDSVAVVFEVQKGVEWFINHILYAKYTGRNVTAGVIGSVAQSTAEQVVVTVTTQQVDRAYVA